jgi:hypothetical protein
MVTKYRTGGIVIVTEGTPLHIHMRRYKFYYYYYYYYYRYTLTLLQESREIGIGTHCLETGKDVELTMTESK